jgi:hypothetical protein
MAAVDFPNSPTTNQVFTSGSLQYVWDGAKWESGLLTSFAPLTNPAGGTQNYAPIASPTFTGTTTDANLSVAGTTTLTGNASVTSQLSVGSGGSGALYYKGTLVETQFAPITNPTSGTANYAPIASPTFTGTVTAPTITVSTAATFSAPILQVPPSGQSFAIGPTLTTPYFSIDANAGGSSLSDGGYYTGSNWMATQTGSAMMQLVSSGAIYLYTNTGLTVGSAYTPSITAQFTPASGQLLLGVTNASNSPAGWVGEFITATGSNVALTAATAVTIASVTLTAGEWEVWAGGQLGGSPASPSNWQIYIQSSAQGLPVGIGYAIKLGSITAGDIISTSIGRYNVAASFTVNMQSYLNAFTGSASVSGSICARRVR